MAKKDCELCKGTGFVLDEKGVANICECVKKDEEAVLRALRIPEKFKDAKLEDFSELGNSKKYPKGALIMSSILSFVKNFKEKSLKEGRGLFFIGPPGVGKTRLSIAILKEIYLKNNVKGLFFDTKDLIFNLKSLIDVKGNSKFLRYVSRVKLLVLDDIGSEMLSDWNKDILLYLINTRYNSCLPTIYTSNLEIEQTKQKVPLIGEKEEYFLKNFYVQNLSTKFGPAIASRFYETCDIIYLNSPIDKRKEKQKQISLQ